MPVSRNVTPDDQQLIRYVLGLLSDEDAERLDEQSIVDDEIAERLQVVEDDLVDDYVRGRLSSEMSARFEMAYMASASRREKVAFARRFVDAVDRAPVTAAVVPLAVRRTWAIWPLATAAALLLACGTLALQQVQLRRGLAGAQRASATIEQRVNALTAQLDQQHAVNGEMAEALARVRSAQPSTPFALVLLPQTRGLESVSKITVGAGADAVPMALRIETAGFARYEVALKDPATNHIRWRSSSLTPDASRPPVVHVAIPAGLLRPQHYSLELTGQNAAGVREVVGSYAFEVVR